MSSSKNTTKNGNNGIFKSVNEMEGNDSVVELESDINKAG